MKRIPVLSTLMAVVFALAFMACSQSESKGPHLGNRDWATVERQGAGVTIVKGDNKALAILPGDKISIARYSFPDTECVMELNGKKVSWLIIPNLVLNATDCRVAELINRCGGIESWQAAVKQNLLDATRKYAKNCLVSNILPENFEVAIFAETGKIFEALGYTLEKNPRGTNLRILP